MKVYITRKIPDPAVSLLDEVFDVSMWPVEDSCVPRDVLLSEFTVTVQHTIQITEDQSMHVMPLFVLSYPVL